ncbi:MAG: hypothetical protein GKS05_11985 [Nitrospirales bacterium]|nr:hypothetical protein [Nitrospirales bacterium]
MKRRLSAIVGFSQSIVFGCLLLVFGCGPFLASTYAYNREAVTLPTPLGYVSDYAEVLEAGWEARIRSVCKELEKATGVEMIVVMMPTIHPMVHAKDFASNMYEGWRIGTAQQERGILVLAALKEKQAVVVLGRALLSVMTPQQLNQLSEQHFLPMFQTHEFGEGIYQAVVTLASVSGSVKPSSEKKPGKSQAGFWMNVSAALAMVYVLWRFTRPERQHPFRRWKRGEYWGTGQGGFRGNFGGFGGGMGGQGLS